MAAKFIDHSDVVLRKIGSASQASMENAGDMLVEAVQEKILYGYHDVHGNPPHTEIVDTGKLFESIDVKFVKDSQNAYSVMVGADTPYAIYVHNGTPKLKGRAFITDAVMENQDKIREILSETIANHMKS